MLQESTTRRTFIRTSWIPPVLWAATWLYVRGYDGWGAWAAAPLLLPSFVASAVWGCAGLVLLGGVMVRTRELDVPLLAATLVSGGVAAYYLLRAWT